MVQNGACEAEAAETTVRFDERFLDEIKSRLRPSDVIGKTVKLRKQGREREEHAIEALLDLGDLDQPARFLERGGIGLRRDGRRRGLGMRRGRQKQRGTEDQWPLHAATFCFTRALR